ncbi:DUF4376 domain-containing protein [Pseudomonas jessenii]|uniref:Uncharacterized protein DUF4376 n=1 Tax=Pseudomonas jessenii TaxID=77298 RepID=A0A370STR2_PSEJE|nr:DUF4376 domain-containing protein [Pseudomonas jessenii]RDL23127.1 uncharacterized protein DUF4376 [Pseudomonas jessenii]
MKFALFDKNSALLTCLIDGIHQIPDSAIKIDDSLFMRLTQEKDGAWLLVGGEIVKQPFPEVAPNYANVVAAERFKREAAGVVVDGLHIETTRESQALIASTGLSAVLDPEYRCNFKTVEGFVEIGATQIIEIAKAVRVHVQACFDREKALIDSISAGTYRDEMLAEGWPDSSLPKSANLQ